MLDHGGLPVDLGKEIQKADELFFLINLLSAIFMVIPMIGDFLAIARPALALLGRALLYLGEAGGLALTIKGVVDDLSSAPWLIFNLVMSAKCI